MSKVMLVNVTHVEESRVAILNNGVLEAYEIETLNRAQLKGNIHNAVVESVHASLEAAFLRIGPDLKGFLPLDEVNFRLLPARGERGKTGKIGQHLRPGQKLMVQVVREPFAGKPPSVSTYFSLPGRHLVLMPGVDSGGVSRKIDDAKQRDRLKKIVDELSPPEGFGLIVRTAGVGQTKTELMRDMRYLLRLWQSIHRAAEAVGFPGLVYRERDLVIRTIRDHFTPDIQEVWIDSEDTYERALEFMRDVMPQKAKTLRLYSGQRPLFNKYNLEEQIESIYKRRVTLPAGGEIVIDGTEALTAIDVNSARSQGKSEVEETATRTNLEAAAEIARQLRLRDLGGLVVIDFIDMMKKSNQKKVEKTMREAMKGGKAKFDITPISKLGLMEIARQRLKGEKMRSSYTSCPTCEGYGLIKNVEAAALAALRKLQTRSARRDISRVRLELPPEVASWIQNHKREALVQIEQRHGLEIEIAPIEAMLRHQSEVLIETRSPRDKSDDPPAPPAGQAETVAAAEGEGGDAAAKADKERPKRRRRRRHSRPGVLTGSDESSQAPEEASGATGADEAPADGNEGEGEAATPRRKRRRRRRRRPAAEAKNVNGAPGDATAPAEGKVDEEKVVVPRNVRSDELVPAAAGGRSSRSRSRGRGGRRAAGSGRGGGGRRSS